MATGREKRRKRKPPSGVKPDNPAQSKRFIEAAKEMGADPEAFQRALDRIVPKKKGKDGSN